MPRDSQAQFEAVASALTASSAAVKGKMFGMPTLMIHGKAFAGLFKDAMAFKLRGEEHARALALPGARAVRPVGPWAPDERVGGGAAQTCSAVARAGATGAPVRVRRTLRLPSGRRGFESRSSDRALRTLGIR